MSEDRVASLAALLHRLDRIIGFAQEIQRATPPGDAQQCARHVEYEAKAACREVGVQYAPREPSHWTLGTLAAEMGRAIRHEVPPGAIQADATELIALTCANVALRGAAQGLGEPPDPDDDEIAALRSALESLLPGYCEKWCPPPLCAPGEIHNAYCAKAQAALARGVSSLRAPHIDTPEHAHWENGYLAGWRDAESEYGPFVPTPVEPDSAAARRFHEIMGQVREEIRAGRTPEQELRDALTAVRPLIEREDVEDEEWCAAFGKEIPTLVDAAYRFLDGLRAPQGGPGLNLSAVNLARCTAPDGFNHPLASWSAAEWTNAVAGEAGEACNLAKKLIRHRDGVPGNKKPEDLDQDSLRRRIAEELADVVIYCDLAMASVGYDFATVVRDVFNRKSQELGSPYLVAGSGAETPPQPETKS